MGWVSIDWFGANKLGCVVSENKQIITISQLKEENREVCRNSLTLLQRQLISHVNYMFVRSKHIQNKGFPLRVLIRYINSLKKKKKRTKKKR